MILISYRYGVNTFHIGRADNMDEAEELAKVILKQLGVDEYRRSSQMDESQVSTQVVSYKKYDSSAGYFGEVELKDLSNLPTDWDLVARGAEGWLQYFKKNEGLELP